MSGATRIGVNLTWLRPGVVGGSEEYTVRLLEAVAPVLPDGLGLRVYGRSDLALAHPGLVAAHEFVEAPILPGGRIGRVVTESTWLAAQTGHDLVVHHAGGTVPLRRNRPSIVTIFDLQPIEHPHRFGPIKRRWLGASLPRAVAAAERVVCLSRHTADRLRDLLGVPEAKLRVVPYGQPLPPVPEPQPGSPGSTASSPAVDVDRFGRYLLFPAIAYPHKRHIDLVEAMARLGRSLNDVSLVLTGREGPELPPVLDRARSLGLGHRVHVLGRVPEADLVALYGSARALVYPSAYEGFGLPVMEAMALGCPVVVSDAGPLPEVVDRAGLVCPVGDVDALAAAVTEVVGDPTRAAELRRLGRDRAAEFTVERAAARLVEVYREVADDIQARGPARA